MVQLMQIDKTIKMIELNLEEKDTIGRVDLISGMELKNDDGEISRNCARFEQQKGTLYVTSLNSNDAFLRFPSGHKVRLVKDQKLALPSNSQLQFANRHITVEYSFDDPSIFSQLTEDGDVTEEELDEDERSKTTGPTQTQPIFQASQTQ